MRAQWCSAGQRHNSVTADRDSSGANTAAQHSTRRPRNSYTCGTNRCTETTASSVSSQCSKQCADPCYLDNHQQQHPHALGAAALCCDASTHTHTARYTDITNTATAARDTRCARKQADASRRTHAHSTALQRSHTRFHIANMLMYHCPARRLLHLSPWSSQAA